MQTLSASEILNSVNKTILIWTTALENYSIEDLRRRPLENEWSLGQVYQHVIDDTKYFIEQAEICLVFDRNTGKTMHEDAKAMFANNCFPAAKLANPFNDINMPQPQSTLVLLQELAKIKSAVNDFTVQNLETAKGKTPHPGLGYFNSLEWLQFADMHMRHHLRQKENIDKVLFGR